MSLLIVTLPAELPQPATTYRYTLTADGHSAIRHASTTADHLPFPGRSGETVAMVPALAMSWQRAQLPPQTLGGTARTRAILEGLLEEHLLDDPSRLHFALQPNATHKADIWIAICELAWLRAHLQALESAGRPVGRIVPEIAPGPTASGQLECTIIGTPKDSHVLLAGYGPEQTAVCLPLTAASMLLAAVQSSATRLFAEPAVATLAEQVLCQPVEIQTASQRMLLAARSAWDMAQFDLSARPRARLMRQWGSATRTLWHAPQWRAARWALGITAAVQIVGLNAWAWQERAAWTAKQTAIRQLLTDNFPQIQVVVDAPLQMERELARLRQAGGGMAANDLEPLLAAASAALPAGGAPPARIEYKDGELRLHDLHITEPQHTAMQQALAAQGLAVQIHSASRNVVLSIRQHSAP